MYSSRISIITIAVVSAIFPLTAIAQNKDAHNPGQMRESSAKKGRIQHNIDAKTIRIADGDENLVMLVDYSNGCRIKELYIKGKNTLSDSGACTGFRTAKATFSSRDASAVKAEGSGSEILLTGINYGDDSLRVNETWHFVLLDNKVQWHIDRSYSSAAQLEEMAFPQWSFSNLSVWKGGIMDNGGMVWCKYLANVNDTYGVHTGGVTFWNPESGDGLRISVKRKEGNFIAAKHSHSSKDEFTYTQFVTDTELKPRYNLNRFVHQRADVFSPFAVKPETVTLHLEIGYIDYLKEYSRGVLLGIDADAVRELLNTTGRYGVVDNRIVGANGWTSNWKCLHEPFFAQIGMALNDENYTRNMASTLDQERDQAMTPDGRVLSRWHNADEDQMPGTFNYETGYYEAQWGYTIDSQTGYIINTAEQFDLSGDIDWLRSHKVSCEKALDWLIRRDSNNNGVFEMINNSIAERKASDWLDVVWASFENGFVNAQMYEALNLWADCELIMGDKAKSDYYYRVASRLKESFNKPIEEGGFWNAEKKQYIYWRDEDGIVHGDNLVTPVNFAVIAFGLCDDEERIAIILDEIEKRMIVENLFHWPLCFDSFRKEEVNDTQWPFPTYENGDIFPTWGYMAIRAYVNYDKDIALKYIRNILDQYNKDGLSSQRYSRQTQLGLGSDILAGICTSVTALYRDIYGIRPKWNRMGIEPNMSEVLNGTEFDYTLRGTKYHLKLDVDDYSMMTDDFTIKSKNGFGANKTGRELTYYPDNEERMTLVINAKSENPIYLKINEWGEKEYAWTMMSKDEYTFKITGLQPGKKYRVRINNTESTVNAGTDGSIAIKDDCELPTTYKVSEL